MLSTMTSKERLEAALQGTEVDHLPFSPFLAYLFESLPQSVQDRGQLGLCKDIGADLLNRGAACPVKSHYPETVETKHYLEGELEVTETITPVGSIRMGHRRSAIGETHFPFEHPLKKEEDYKVMMWLEEHLVIEANHEAAQQIFESHPDALHIGMLLPRGKSAFQSMVENLVGTEELIYALTDFPEVVQELHELMVIKNLEAVRLSAMSDYKYFLTWEDSSTQNYSPAWYEKYIASEISQWTAILKEEGKHYIQHACGHVKNLLPIMVKQGIHSVESLSPSPTGDLNIREARELLGAKVGLIGGIEPTELLRRDLKSLRPYVEGIIDAGQGGPFILANSDSCPKGVAIEKLQMIASMVKDVQPNFG